MEVSNELLRQYKSLNLTNPMEMVCNPYNTTGAQVSASSLGCTDPPQNQTLIDLWESAACGVKYNLSSLDDDKCPTEYSLHSYESKKAMLDDGATMTHWGACGVCSSLADLSVYLSYPDLTTKGTECSLRALEEFQDGIKCYQEVGYTAPCAEMWVYNGFNTKEKCLGYCASFTIFKRPNNGPAPYCKLDDCLLCDEQMSGPAFQTVAARSRRRSGLLSKIARPCDRILLVDSDGPCNTTRKAVGERELLPTRRLQAPKAPEYWQPPEPTESCSYMKLDVGLNTYSSSKTNNFIDIPLFESEEQRFQTTLQNTCKKYDFRRSFDGFFSYVKQYMGGVFFGAKACAIMAVIVGGVCCVLVWTTACFAAPSIYWKVIAGLFFLCGLFSWCTLMFFASPICEYGCEIRGAAYCAIIAGVFWCLASLFSWRAQVYRMDQRNIKCCCCPRPGMEDEVENQYSAVPRHAPDEDGVRERIDISVTEMVNPDGSVTTEKVTTYPDGTKSVETTTSKRTEVLLESEVHSGDKGNVDEPLSETSRDSCSTGDQHDILPGN